VKRVVLAQLVLVTVEYKVEEFVDQCGLVSFGVEQNLRIKFLDAEVVQTLARVAITGHLLIGTEPNRDLPFFEVQDLLPEREQASELANSHGVVRARFRLV